MRLRSLNQQLQGEALRFILIGIIATGLHYGLYLLFKQWIGINLAYTAGYILSFIVNYYLSNFFTFNTEPNLKKGIGFIICHSINYGLHLILLHSFIWVGISQALAPLFVYAIAIPVNFMLVRFALKGKAPH